MAGLTFVQLVNATLSGSFSEAHRTDAQRWVNVRHAKLVDLHPWNFRYATDLVTVTSGSNDVSGVATDIDEVVSFQRDDGTMLEPLEDIRVFQQRYYDAVYTPQGVPEAFTVINGTVKVGPQPTVSSSSYQLVYLKAATEMSSDSDVPIVPWQYHNTIVMGAKAEGMRSIGIPLWGEMEEAWERDIVSMERSYLSTVSRAGEPFSGQFVPGRA